jgi:hypothetical protein
LQIVKGIVVSRLGECEEARNAMKESTSRAQHYHDLALEFLVMMRFTAAAQVRKRYRMMGEHYLAKAGAELARAKNDPPARNLEAALGWAKAAEAFEIGQRVAPVTPDRPRPHLPNLAGPSQQGDLAV